MDSKAPSSIIGHDNQSLKAMLLDTFDIIELDGNGKIKRVNFSCLDFVKKHIFERYSYAYDYEPSAKKIFIKDDIHYINGFEGYLHTIPKVYFNFDEK